MATQLDQMWQQQALPIVNGVVFRSGRIVQIRSMIVAGQPALERMGESTLSEFLAASEAISQIDSLANILLANAGNAARAVCGEGSMGGDGFVAVLDQGDAILWAAVFDRSNPFQELEQRDSELRARSNLGECWVFPLSAPDHLRILPALPRRDGGEGQATT